MRQEGDVKKYRVKDYLDFLANVKNIPVGIRPPIWFVPPNDLTTMKTVETSLTSWNFRNIMSFFTTNPNHLAGQYLNQTISFTVTWPFFLGILEVWAEIQFPSMLISPGSLYFRIKFANAQNVFQCTMDPCRRIVGTYHDYVPNSGLNNQYATKYLGQNLDKSKCQTTARACNGAQNPVGV